MPVLVTQSPNADAEYCSSYETCLRFTDTSAATQQLFNWILRILMPELNLATRSSAPAPSKVYHNGSYRGNSSRTALPPVHDEVIARAQAGDHQAFAQLYSLHKRRIYSLCLRMVGDVAAAEDMTQEAFLQLHRKIETFRGESSFSTWLHRIAVNVVLMGLRKKGLQLTSLDEAMEPDAENQRPGRSFGATDIQLSGAIDRLVLKRAISNLPAGYRLMFILHDVEGFDHNEIANLVGCSIGTSKSQLHKARLKLRDALRLHPVQERRR